MRIIPVTTYPLKQPYKTVEAAIEGAKNNPLQAKARADAKKLAGTTVVDAYWTDTDFVIRFSNERLLHIWSCLEEVRWEIAETPPTINENQVRRVGTEPVVYRWRSTPGLREHEEDWSALTAKRRGAEFQQLWVNEFGLWVYLRRQLIWCFGRVRRTDLDQPILSVSEQN